MPGLSGIELVAEARKAGVTTFITLMSARPDDELRGRICSAAIRCGRVSTGRIDRGR
jgi:DNA-binding response OmpR family regulator